MDLKQIGERIEKVRIDSKMSRKQFGERVGLTSQYVGMVERGKNSLSIDSLINICHITEISSDYILFGRLLPLSDLELSIQLKGLSPEQIQIAFDVIKRIASFINTDNGNEILIKEIENQLHNSDLGERIAN